MESQLAKAELLATIPEIYQDFAWFMKIYATTFLTQIYQTLHKNSLARLNPRRLTNILDQ
ncbi:hypothetical protein IQE94_01135 [Synechocystis sp. PCC 7339]|uniref:hypothetical protein n=1 Tax=unclassified Synechocystis TaxID=2640012 RepID=UPI001BAE5DCC|nr:MULTISPECIES: hypothetical protein [unclassified Synechocystis]QUS60802.1 hypothetical protein HTZ78_09060 [Synechocystis sp. PCC 7338]UAJ72992.1 hypothetical protein IQE94_01135 [Synechocystis sp. PCC 7339]